MLSTDVFAGEVFRLHVQFAAQMRYTGVANDVPMERKALLSKFNCSMTL